MRILFAVFLCTLSSRLVAADLVGHWALKASGVTIMRFDIDESPTGWSAIWWQPEHFSTDGYAFTRLGGTVIQRSSASFEKLEDGLKFVFNDPDPGDLPDVFRITQLDQDNATVVWAGMPFEPFELLREPAGMTIGPFDPAQTYVRVIDRRTNKEMTALYDADQAARQTMPADWTKIALQDSKRRARTQELLDSGQLQSGEDFRHAAFIFQHGDQGRDYLKAHLLAIIAIARGSPAATWIAAASLDRYLISIGQPQVLGTQSRLSADGKMTKDPIDDRLISDALRTSLGVPSLAEQGLSRKSVATPGNNSEP